MTFIYIIPETATPAATRAGAPARRPAGPGAGARRVRERGADGAVRVDGGGLDVHRHRLGARERQRGRAARDQRRVQAVLQAVVLPRARPS